MSKKKLDDNRLQLITLAAWAHGEISIGCAREVLGWPDDKIRGEAEKRVSDATKQKAYIEKLESELEEKRTGFQRAGVHVWAEQPGMRVGVDRLENGSVVFRLYSEDYVDVRATIAPYRWERILKCVSPELTRASESGNDK